MMLQHLEYGVSTPSSVAPFLHPEDAQPNEQLNRRNRNLPPRVSSTAQNTRGTPSFRGRGGYRGRGMSQHGWTQYAVRGRRGRGSQPKRGGHSSSRNGPILEHWSVTESRRSEGSMQLDPTMPLGVSASSSSSSPSSSSRSRNAGDRSRSPAGWYADKETVPTKRRYSPTPYVSQASLSSTSATPPASEGPLYIEKSRHWMLRSRSPTPKLPPSPLKRRKHDHVPDSCDDGTRMLPPPFIGLKTPLPGRHQRKSFTMQQPVVQQRPPTPDIVLVDIKAEPRSPTPPQSIKPQRKLVTESCEFYPLPDSCKKSNPDYRENRKKFFQQKNSHLIRMGLKKTKVFYRDDGLVIEWTSKVPVWSDTLQPDIPDLATAIQLAHTINHDLNSLGSNKSQKRKRPTPLQSSTEEPSPKKSSSTQPTPSKSLKSNATIQTHWASGVPEDQLEIVSRLGSAARKPSTSEPRLQTSPMGAIRPQSQTQVSQKRIALPTRRNGAVPMKPLSASAATRVTPVAFSPRDPEFGGRVTSAPPPVLPTRSASSTPTPRATGDSSGPSTKWMVFKPTIPPRKKSLQNSLPSPMPSRTSGEAGPSPSRSLGQSATSTPAQNPVPKPGPPGVPPTDGCGRHPVVLKRMPKPQEPASSMPFAGFFEPVEPVAGPSSPTSNSISVSTSNVIPSSSLSISTATDAPSSSTQRRSSTPRVNIKEEAIQAVGWEPRRPTSTPTPEPTTSPGSADASTASRPTAVSGTSSPGQISRKSTTPAPLPGSVADVHRPSPRSRVPTPASHSGSKIVAAGEVYVEEQVDVPVPSEKGKEEAKATVPEIEREPMDDGDLGDADCIARELLCDSPDDQGKDKHLDGRGSAGSSSDEEEDEEEGDELMALSTDYLQRYIHLFDTDRSKLEMAYAKNALFSCRVHHLQEPSYSMAGLFAPEVKPSFRSTHSRASPSMVIQGRPQISNTLLTMGPYQFGARGVSGTVYYDAVPFGSGSISGTESETTNNNVLVTMHGEVVNVNVMGPELDHVLTVDQSFVLRRRREEEESSDEDALGGHGGLVRKGVLQDWPLIAISHQMTVRAASLLPAERLEELLPWIQDIL